MTVKTGNMLKEVDKKLHFVKARGDYHANLAIFYKKIYLLSGLKWAKEMNQYHYQEGMRWLIGGLTACTACLAVAFSEDEEL